jgi:hypothetical protein
MKRYLVTIINIKKIRETRKEYKQRKIEVRETMDYVYTGNERNEEKLNKVG